MPAAFTEEIEASAVEVELGLDAYLPAAWIPAAAEALVHQFLVRARLARLGIRRLLWREETYLVEYTDRAALERVLAAEAVEVRPLRAGATHLLIPRDRRAPAAELAWFERHLD